MRCVVGAELTAGGRLSTHAVLADFPYCVTCVRSGSAGWALIRGILDLTGRLVGYGRLGCEISCFGDRSCEAELGFDDCCVTVNADLLLRMGWDWI